MIRRSPLRKVMSLIKKERFRRKWDIHKLALGVMIDKTTAIYLGVLLGYVFISMFIVGDVIGDYHDQFIMIETQLRKRIWFIATLLPVAYIIQSFSRPGIVFSKTEYRLTLLPYSKKGIWLLCAAEKWLKKLCVYIVIGGLISLVTPISLWVIMGYILMLLFIDMLMTMPQWILFQMSIVSKIGVLTLVIILNIINIYYQFKPFAIGIIILLILLNIRLSRMLFTNVNWGRVTEVSDFQLWHMPIVSKASDIKMERRKLYSILQNMDMLKSPLEYTKGAIHQRLWFVYFVRNLKPLIQIVGSLFALLCLFMFISEGIFHIGIALAIHIYTTVIISFFRGHFGNDLLQVLPWQLDDFRQSFVRWGTYGTLILLIPVATYLSLHASLWVPLQTFFYIVVFFYMLHVKILKACIILSRQPLEIQLDEGLSYLFLVALIFSWKYPVILLSSFIVLWLIYRLKRRQLFV